MRKKITNAIQKRLDSIEKTLDALETVCNRAGEKLGVNLSDSGGEGAVVKRCPQNAGHTHWGNVQCKAGKPAPANTASVTLTCAANEQMVLNGMKVNKNYRVPAGTYNITCHGCRSAAETVVVQNNKQARVVIARAS